MQHYFNQFMGNGSAFKHGLPAYAYTSNEFWNLEQQTVFSNNWVFVGFAHQMPDPGDARPVTVGGRPVLLLRGDDDEIRAFHNVCRHRCLKLVDEPKNCGKSVRCPYHSWIYTLRGDLKVAPFFGGGERQTPADFYPEDKGLTQMFCSVWNDWIFVNVDDNPVDFDNFVAPLKRQLGGVALDNIKPLAMIDLGVVESNWKFLMENFIEPYHVQFVHRSTTQQPLKSHYTVRDHHCLGSGCEIDETTERDTVNTLAVTSHYLTLFPNFVLGTYAPDQVGVHLNIPLNEHQTQQYRVIYTHQDSNIPSTRIEQLKKLWFDVHKEDHAICERLQAGRSSPVAEIGGYLSPHWEDSVYDFQKLVVQATFNQNRI